ncbi:GreA/GreB family elongation factor [Fredinandcohnia sp. QZ13]|uniref:GreA/GreB family elongation factor n=1 Tax=Fredinandcohnia sp. QZ13 TaxID=3073144 RepID=UPI00285314A6|nr:GreA/GreB family elongation factor [Fredinandcohnia sp. QZ13]MDR4888283.1 GreA/GreB family elongation factor [Fredinandcohnia sp. QZ13]
MSHKDYFAEQLQLIDTNFQELKSLYLSSTPLKERDQNFLSSYINELKSYLEIEVSGPIPKVFIGTKVTVMFDGDDDTEDYYICLPKQSDPDAGCISFLSPVGRQLLLRKVDDNVLLNTPAGSLPVTIKSITFAENLILQR